MTISYTRRRRDSREFTTTGSGVTYTRATGTRGPNLIDDSTDIGTLTNAVADALFLLAGRADGLKPRKITLAAIHRSILAAADAAGVRSAIGADAAGDARPPAAHTHPLSALTQSGATSGQVPAWSGSAWVATTVTSGGGGTWGSITGTLSSQTDLQTALNARAALASANTFTTGPQVFVGGATVRQAGGTAGTDEVQVYHDGTRGWIESKDGPMRIMVPGTFATLQLSSGTGAFPTLTNVVHGTADGGYVRFENAMVLGRITDTMRVDFQLVTLNGLLSLATYTVATLPSASANAGRIAQVTDSNTTTNGSTVGGGGANRVPVFSNGTNWIVK